MKTQTRNFFLSLFALLQVTSIANTRTKFTHQQSKTTNHLLTNRTIRKLSTNGFSYSLSNSTLCYIVDKSVLSKLEINNVRDYLANGGYILINDKSVTISDVVGHIAFREGELNFVDFSNSHGTFFFMRENKIRVYSYAIEFVNDSPDHLASDKEFLLQEKDILKSISFDDIASHIIDFIVDNPDTNMNDSNLTNTNHLEEGIVLGKATCINLLYGIWFGTFMCAYQIDTKVIEGQKYYDKSTGKKRGIYDIVSKFIVDAEPSYRVSKYEPKISSNQPIIDSTYINSNVSETYSLGGEIGLSYDEIGANINFSYSYSGTSTSQSIINNIPIGQLYRSWIAEPYNGGEYNASYQLFPAIRIVSEDDEQEMSSTLTLQSFFIFNNWWINLPFHMVDACRKNLTIKWYANSEISSTEYYGN